MTGVDWIIVGAVALLALFGYSQGFLAGALSLVGFALGAFLGTRLGPLVLPDGDESPYAPLFGLLGALLVGAVLASGFEGLGALMRRSLRVAPGATTLDGVLGAVLMGCVGLGLAWVLGAVALQTPGARGLRRDVQRSGILARLNTVLPSRRPPHTPPPLAGRPPPPPPFDPFPRISGVDIGVDPPSPRIAHRAKVAAARPSVVK